ncbi:hypothetical protein GCM10008014_08180 [Paenibacillus silvae]|uniref:Uncharacterized protein n=1 Tax=Paenibacillus silvae TaxID=1325358 RepID=A0ABQ1Z2V5_9BACL|nr:hypothetical protein [Paenibacillus silvae]GGH45872.1 hypothetical protein GCM10008014_08180 [Paenibacillus silvae]
MIEMDEDEYQESAVSDDTLHLVSLFCGPEIRDKLLYRRVDDAIRLRNRNCTINSEKRPHAIDSGNGRFFDSQATPYESASEEIHTVDVPR